MPAESQRMCPIAGQLSAMPATLTVPARRLRHRLGRQGDTWYLDELFVKIQGRQQYLWRAVDEDGDVLDILVQSRRNRRAAVRFFRKLLKRQGCEPRRLITDKLRSFSAAHRTVMPSVIHSTRQYENNRAEVSHQPTRQRERQMAPIQVGRPSTTVRIGARRRTESVPGRPTSAPHCALPSAASALLGHMGRSDVRLLTERGHSAPRERNALSSAT